MYGPLPRLHRLGNQLCRQFDFFEDSQSAIRGFFQSQVPRIPSLLNLGGISKPELHEADRDTASLYVELPTRCFFHNRIPGQRLYRLLDSRLSNREITGSNPEEVQSCTLYFGNKNQCTSKPA
ncbi:hypothetical protein J6590_095744 [Homalodisca vitripennis]|nr:hypothetical protein J6590_095744 [Homalodisca vitripennis]